MTTAATQMRRNYPENFTARRDDIGNHRRLSFEIVSSGTERPSKAIPTSLKVICLGSEAHFVATCHAATHCGLEVRHAGSSAEALHEAELDQCNVVVVELPYADLAVDEFLDSMRQTSPSIAVIFSLPASGVSDAVRITRLGAYSVVDATMDQYQLAGVLDRAASEVRSRRAASYQEVDAWRRLLVGKSPAMQEIARVIELVASRRCTVLITGETGTGKEIVARAMHKAGDRAQKPFIALNCSAIPEHLLEAELFGHMKGAFTGAVVDRTGRFEEADGGTLFLDEIGDMPFELQAKLLRVLQEREVQRLGSSRTVKVNVRVIAASNLDLLERVKQKQFREDLYYRLNVLPIQIAPLRERLSDVGLLARHFVDKVCRMEGIPVKEVYNETLDLLALYDWPGNVRQLENVVERAVVISGERQYLVPGDFALPSSAVRLTPVRPIAQHVSVSEQGIDFEQLVNSFEKNLLDQALERSNGNKSMAADLLRLKRSTLVSKLRVFEQYAAA